MDTKIPVIFIILPHPGVIFNPNHHPCNKAYLYPNHISQTPETQASV